MDSTSWVRGYIHTLFESDLAQQGLALRDSKLSYINLPLYKYCYVCEEASRTATTVDYNIENFENEVLFFQTPDKFNDPFDCYLGFSQSQLIRKLLFQEIRSRKQLTPQVKTVIGQLFRVCFQKDN